MERYAAVLIAVIVAGVFLICRELGAIETQLIKYRYLRFPEEAAKQDRKG